jgi:hypothetical protein
MNRTVCMALWVLSSAAVALPAGASTVKGTLLYQKIPATSAGLDLSHPVESPAPQIHVEIRTPDQSKLLAEGHTDDQGSYALEIPEGSGPVVLRARSETEQIYVGSSADKVYVVATGAFDPASAPAQVLIGDENRLSGPFNILATLQRANRLLAQVDPSFHLSDIGLAVVWSPTSERTTFRRAENTIFLAGNRDNDSDEFDDSVILQTYGHYLLSRFSRNDSPGGSWNFREWLDPRLAWSSGWVCFFAQAVLGTPVFLDTYGPAGSKAFALDLEPDTLEGDIPGYCSVFTVSSALWDMFADTGSGSDHLGLGLGPIWRVLRDDFPQQVFVSFLTLVDGLLRSDPSLGSGVTAMLARRQIDYKVGVVPPVADPFPRPLTPGATVTGTVDSFTSKRTNLRDSADYYLIRKETDKPISLELTATGAAASGGPVTLVLQLYDAAGTAVGATSLLIRTGGQIQITKTVPAGTYVIGLLSYAQSRTDTIFGGASYELTADF